MFVNIVLPLYLVRKNINKYTKHFENIHIDLERREVKDCLCAQTTQMLNYSLAEMISPL